MNVKRLAVLLLGCLAVLFLATSPASAQCNVKFLNVTVAPDLNAEGITERAADIVIYGTGCFVPTTITVGYNAIMTVPTTPLTGSVSILSKKGTYWDVVDATDTLSVKDITIGTQIVSSGTASVVTITIDGGTTNPAAYLVVENLRFDVTGSTCHTTYTPGCQSVSDTHSLNASISSSAPPQNLPPFDIGNVKKTIDPLRTGVTNIGWGFEDGVCPFSGYCGYPNKGATSGSLIAQAWWEMATNGAWITDFPFRRVGEHSPNSADPNLIGPTDLVLHVQNIMGGVTVTVPNALIVCGSEEGKVAEWDFAGGSKTSTGGDLVAIYKTVFSNLTNPVSLNVGTTNGPPDPGCDSSPYPLISVVIGNPSLNSADGTMQAYLNVVMGPATKAQFTGDDAQPSAVPRYLDDVAFPDRPTRDIIGAANITDPFAAPYFFLNPTQTVLLYPYVTNANGWNTGIEVGNTGLDTPVFGNTGQNGKLDFYFFGNSGATFSYTAKAGDGTGLDASGNLDAGGDFAITLSNLLSAAGHGGTFTGYIIVVAHFNFGHGAGLLFTGSTNTTAVPALVLGGRCSYNPNKAQPNPTTGAPNFPACSSARQGDITKLPERLVM